MWLVANKLAEKLEKENINVNLMISVVAANRPGSNWLDREVSNNRLSNLNFYQTNLTLHEQTASLGVEVENHYLMKVGKR